MIRVGIVSAVPAVRIGLRSILAGSKSAGDGEWIIQVEYEVSELSEIDWDSNVVDVIVLSQESALLDDLQRVAANNDGRSALLMLSDDPKSAQHLSGLPLRAWGILTQDCSTQELRAAVVALNEGLIVGMPALMESFLPYYLEGDEGEEDVSILGLTERESEVLQLVARGLANKQIAHDLGISEHTVKFHVSSIFSKLGATNRAEAVRVGVKRGLVIL